MLRATPIFILILVYLFQNFLGAPGPVSPDPTGITLAAAPESATRLLATDIPGRDLYDLSGRRKRHQGGPIPHTGRATTIERTVGDKEEFSVAIEGESCYKLPATPQFVTDRAYWYVADESDTNMEALE